MKNEESAVLNEDAVKFETKNPIAKALLRGFFKKLNGLLDIVAFETVYDAGCGCGYVTEFVQQKYPATVIDAMDIDEDKLAQAKKRCPGVNFLSGDIYTTECESNSFDLVISSEVLEHLENPMEALNELIRISKRYVLVSIPNEPLWRMANMARFKYLNAFGNTPGHINHWSKRTFKKLLKDVIIIKKIKTPFPFIIVLCEKRDDL